MLNRVALQATLTEAKPARYTPAGLLCVEATLSVDEPPAIPFNVGVIAFDESAKLLSNVKLGEKLQCQGKLQPVSRRNAKLVIALDSFEILN
jgi:primosomal replication protein N